jgi:hypothetical protein
MTRTETALQLRDYALSIARDHGSYELVGDAKYLMWRGDTFTILHRTPFQHRTEPDEAAKKLAAKIGASVDEAKYAATLHGVKLPEALPYGLDVWHGKKVFSLEWSDDGRSRVISFKRGPWEEELLALDGGILLRDDNS